MNKVLPEEDWHKISTQKKEVENRELINIARLHTVKNFFENTMFPNIIDADIPQLLETQNIILDKFYIKDNDSFEIDLNVVGMIFNKYQDQNAFKKLYEFGIFQGFQFKEDSSNQQRHFHLKGNHPTLPSIDGEIKLFSIKY